ILNLQDRRRVRLFVRRDAFGRFVSCLAYVPKDKYNTEVRRRIEAVLQRRFRGERVDTELQISEAAMARMSVLVRMPAGTGRRIDVAAAEAEVAAAIVTWQDRLLTALLERHGTSRGHELFDRYGGGFPAAYQEDLDPAEACHDIGSIVRIVDEHRDLELRLLASADSADPSLRFKLIRPAESLPLSDVLPILENFGMTVLSERPYRIECAGGPMVSVQDVEMLPPGGQAADFGELAGRFEDAFRQVIDGEAENDGLNRLVWLAGLDSREILILRACCKYILQTGAPFSQTYMENVLCEHSDAAGILAGVFMARFRPGLSDGERRRAVEPMEDELRRSLERVTSLDDDRILRAFEAVMAATLRTNFFATATSGSPGRHVSLKLDPQLIPELPEPRPQFEIFVYSPEVEGIHLRAGRVARGGLRWSDRREDFRTEVLGLMKAQVVKNAVIVPTGAKGGFVVKCPCPPTATTREVQQDVERCYRIFIEGLLDVSDNVVDGSVLPPEDNVRRDGDDPYLVVAADKGTATFSDIANGIAEARGFWLGDAFASGGSDGYDHKKMGITARGAWEAVKRHFRELGTDVQAEPFTVAGIGDMAGDVFGNGMLLSRQIRLRAAFNHRHIFLDPDPDPETSFLERERLFAASGSTWRDYGRTSISPGGGVFDRHAKRIDLSPEARAMLDTTAESMTPPEIIRLILCMDVDLLWNGGIGTYVKAESETHLDAGDRANDAVRVNAHELRARVVGEGGNLGLTQQARIEYARAGGRINTDSVDNSAGVNTSDREVNIKILLDHARREKRLGHAARNRLLAAMTDEVAALVLRDNYLQTQAISVAATYAPERLLEHAELIRSLEHSGQLDRALEGLPGDEEIEHRRSVGEGLSRPELAILISYAKIHLYTELVGSDVPEDAAQAGELELYFPARLHKRFRDLIAVHPLRREIISTLIANSIINRMGPYFVLRAQQETGAGIGAVARAYSVVREIFDMRDTWSSIESLDNVIPSSAQYAMHFQGARSLRHATHWFLQKHPNDLDIGTHVKLLRPGVRVLLKEYGGILRGSPGQRLAGTIEQYEQLGVPGVLATRMATLNASVSALDVASMSRQFNRSAEFVARVYMELGRGLNLGWLQARVEHLDARGRWQAVARGNMRDAILAVQRTLTTNRLQEAGTESADALVVNWLEDSGPRIQRAKQMLLEMRAQKSVDFATLTVALAELRRLAGP
ncbi:MAG: NAD-glutamate dehydrogenase, partial [Gammaproteobacteria bacterium]